MKSSDMQQFYSEYLRRQRAWLGVTPDQALRSLDELLQWSEPSAGSQATGDETRAAVDAGLLG